mmetsp:Transcript_57362/g.92953  ORF Transcript_57362/g.92953 Transcript_57362/m.92953 type:complete len:939 (+) Transcript_57362:131-2947(+)
MTVAAARKQQKEVDVVLKKVEDGIEEFDYIFEQAASACCGNQKEKQLERARLGEELKKAINKLQRLRIQIREWIQQADFKGSLKDKLEEARKRIESDMTRFKEFERDLKTKAFSSNALAKDDVLDLEEEEKMRYQEWLSMTIDTLNTQRDEFEADLEILSNKKALSSSEKDSMSTLREEQDRHSWHIGKLELLLRALDNEALDMSDLALLRDSVDYYLESHSEPGFMMDEGLYDGFDLQEFEEKAMKPQATEEAVSEAGKESAATPVAAGKAEEPALAKAKAKEKAKEKDKKKDKKKDEKTPKTQTPNGAAVGAAVVGGKVVAVSKVLGKDAVQQVSGPEAKVVEAKKVIRSIVDDLAEDEAKVQADQLLGDAEEFICKICQVHVVGCSPKLTNCSHLFCGDCLAQWFAQHPESQTWAQRARSAGPERVVPCPVCKQPLNEKKDLYPVCGATSRSENLLLWRMLSSLKIVCMNSSQLRPKDGRCDWVGEYGQYQKHAKACSNLPMAEYGEESREAAPEPVVVRPQLSLPPARPDVLPIGESVAPPVAPVAPAAPTSHPIVTQAQAPLVLARPQETLASTPVGAAPRPVPASQKVAPTMAPRVQQPLPAPHKPPHQMPQHLQPSQQPQQIPQPQSPFVAEPHPVAAVSPGASAATSFSQKAVDSTPAVEEVASASSAVIRATCAFEPTGPNMVQVRPGDMVQVLERHASGWAFCKNLSTPNGTDGAAGWAPNWIVQAAQSTEEDKAPQASQSSHSQAQASKEPQRQQAAAVAAAPTPQHGVLASPASPALSPVSSATGAPAHLALQPAMAAPTTPAVVQVAAAAPAVKPPVVSPQPTAQPAVSSQAVLRPPPVAAAVAVAAAAAEAPAPAPAAAPKAPQTVVRAAIAPFSAATSSQLSLALGELVEIVERDMSGWTYGRKVLHQAVPVEGWFPDWCTKK